ncbi:hypothetical protein HELRODRAFT_188202 [Helobdella robusta]|uniref:Nucleoporin NUP188 homolog n=1 Tax=Helobdella robusta TaxID=6412 RepID=T1FPR9_HELRO|nr:hypothetical protein HELRODRAFT_188202 [Helobdella robusta]ESO05861.1 hypothetical protein HELRODRAFT_188202 [Helobdella robusta]
MSETLYSTCDFWQFISGASVVWPKDLVKTELEIYRGILKSCLNYYQPWKYLKNNFFLFKNLDLEQCSKLFEMYLSRCYEGTDDDLDKLLSRDPRRDDQLKGLIDDVSAFYFAEKLSLVRSLKLILAYSKDGDVHPYNNEFKEFTTEHLKEDFIVDVFSQFDKLHMETCGAPHNASLMARSKQLETIGSRSSQNRGLDNLKLLCELLDLVLLYFKCTVLTMDQLHSMFEMFKEQWIWQNILINHFNFYLLQEQEFGKKLIASKHILDGSGSHAYVKLANRISYMMVLLVVDGLELELLVESCSLGFMEDERSGMNELILADANYQKFSQQIVKNLPADNNVDPLSPFHLAWAVVQHLKGDPQFGATGNKALAGGVFAYLYERFLDERESRYDEVGAGDLPVSQHNLRTLKLIAFHISRVYTGRYRGPTQSLRCNTIGQILDDGAKSGRVLITWTHTYNGFDVMLHECLSLLATYEKNVGIVENSEIEKATLALSFVAELLRNGGEFVAKSVGQLNRFVDVALAYLNKSLNSGRFGQLLMSHEVVTCSYDVTIAFLNFVLKMVQVAGTICLRIFKYVLDNSGEREADISPGSLSAPLAVVTSLLHSKAANVLLDVVATDLRLLQAALDAQFELIYPMSMYACLGDKVQYIRDIYMERLQSSTEDVNLKIAIIEWLTACLQTQLALTELFISKRDKNKLFGISINQPILSDGDDDVEDRDSILHVLVDLIGVERQFLYRCPSSLLACIMEYFHCMWKKCHLKPITKLRKMKMFWDCLYNVVTTVASLKHKDTKYNKLDCNVVSLSHSLRILAFELIHSLRIKELSYPAELKDFCVKGVIKLLSYFQHRIVHNCTNELANENDVTISSNNNNSNNNDANDNDDRNENFNVTSSSAEMFLFGWRDFMSMLAANKNSDGVTLNGELKSYVIISVYVALLHVKNRTKSLMSATCATLLYFSDCKLEIMKDAKNKEKIMDILTVVCQILNDSLLWSVGMPAVINKEERNKFKALPISLLNMVTEIVSCFCERSKKTKNDDDDVNNGELDVVQAVIGLFLKLSVNHEGAELLAVNQVNEHLGIYVSYLYSNSSVPIHQKQQKFPRQQQQQQQHHQQQQQDNNVNKNTDADINSAQQKQQQQQLRTYHLYVHLISQLLNTLGPLYTTQAMDFIGVHKDRFNFVLECSRIFYSSQQPCRRRSVLDSNSMVNLFHPSSSNQRNLTSSVVGIPARNDTGNLNSIFNTTVATSLHDAGKLKFAGEMASKSFNSIFSSNYNPHNINNMTSPSTFSPFKKSKVTHDSSVQSKTAFGLINQSAFGFNSGINQSAISSPFNQSNLQFGFGDLNNTSANKSSLENYSGSKNIDKEYYIVGDIAVEILELETISLFICQLSKYKKEWMNELPGVLQSIMTNMCTWTHRVVGLLFMPKLLLAISESQKTGQPLNLSLIGLSNLGHHSTDESANFTPEFYKLQQKLLSIVAVNLISMRLFSPPLEEIFFKTDRVLTSFHSFIVMDFSTPFIDDLTPPTFGTLVAIFNFCIDLLGKNEGTRPFSPHKPSTPRSHGSNLSTFVNRKLLLFLMDQVMYLMMSHALKYLREAEVDEQDKQVLKRDLSAEMSSCLMSAYRYLRVGTSSPATPRRSSQGLPAALHFATEHQFLGFADNFVRNVLR